MDARRKLFIYDRKEVGILILLGVGVALFAFTLGVHLGKQVVPKAVDLHAKDESVEVLESAKHENPDRTAIDAEVKHIPGAVSEVLDQNLRDEVAKTGLTIDQPKTVILPSKTKKETHSATQSPESSPEKSSPETGIKVVRPGKGRYTLQVGSYPNLKEAEPELLKLNENGLRPIVKEVELKGKGKWYRVVVGEYASAQDAETAGHSFRKENRIDAFVVIRAQ
jgi:cell division protein FtsN